MREEYKVSKNIILELANESDIISSKYGAHNMDISGEELMVIYRQLKQT